MMRKRQENGITLIALVITIIVLLILAGVTIAMLTGDNGIISKAMQAKIRTEEAKETEEIRNVCKENGIEGFKSQTGKHSSHLALHLRKPKDKIEELEIELMKKDIEIARLKKGYNVKGAGQEKEFITIFNKNIK